MATSPWRIDPVTKNLIAPVGGKTVRGITQVQPDDAATVDYVDTQIAGVSAGEINSGANVGAGAGVFQMKAGLDLQFRSLLAGAGGHIVITQNANDVQIEFAPLEQTHVVTNPGNTNAGPTIIAQHDFPITAGDYSVEAFAQYSCAVKNQPYTADLKFNGTTIAVLTVSPNNDGAQRQVNGFATLPGLGAGLLNASIVCTGAGGANVISVLRWGARIRRL